MSFNFFADEVAFREQTDRQSQMAGVTASERQASAFRVRKDSADGVAALVFDVLNKRR